MENKVTASQIGFRYGLILGLIYIIYSMILQFADMDIKTMQAFGYLNYVILIVAIVLAHKAFKTGGDGFMSLGQGIGSGTLLSVVSGAISGIFSFIYIKFVDDSMLTKIKDMQIEEMEKRGMDDAQIDQAMQVAGMFMSPIAIAIMSVIAMAFFGFILSLIISLFTKKVNPSMEV